MNEDVQARVEAFQKEIFDALEKFAVFQERILLHPFVFWPIVIISVITALITLLAFGMGIGLIIYSLTRGN